MEMVSVPLSVLVELAKYNREEQERYLATGCFDTLASYCEGKAKAYENIINEYNENVIK